MIVADPATPAYVAVMTTEPAVTPVTIPDEDTVATAKVEEPQVAVLLMSCVVPSGSVAVAVNCAVAPTFGAVPVTAIDATGVAEAGESVHAAEAFDKTANRISPATVRTFMDTLPVTGGDITRPLSSPSVPCYCR